MGRISPVFLAGLVLGLPLWGCRQRPSPISLMTGQLAGTWSLREDDGELDLLPPRISFEVTGPIRPISGTEETGLALTPGALFAGSLVAGEERAPFELVLDRGFVVELDRPIRAFHGAERFSIWMTRRESSIPGGQTSPRHHQLLITVRHPGRDRIVRGTYSRGG